MAAIESYSPCPCGSGQKFKWCCHKVEAYAERAQRLFENHQAEPAIAALHEGLKKEPNNAWLLTREALYLLHSGKPEDAKARLRSVLAANPKHLGALSLLTRLILETDGAAEGAAQLQKALADSSPESRQALLPLVKVVASFLASEAEYPAAIRHLLLALKLGGDPGGAITNSIKTLESNPTASAWLKNPDTLSPAPDGLNGPARERFDQALGWAAEGLFTPAAAAFETLSADKVAATAANRNAGFCRLWVAESAPAVASFRRAIALMGATTEAVDLEALCQIIAPPGRDEMVDHVQLIWPLRNRENLLKALRSDPAVHEEGPGPIDAENPESPTVERFALLDKPGLTTTADLTAAMIPRVMGRALVGGEIVALESYDDGRLDRLAERFTTLAVPSIPSAHPKTKVLERVPRHPLALSWEWLLPEKTDEALANRLTTEQSQRVIKDVWPNTPMPGLRGKTPLQAAGQPDAFVPLRAALFVLELTRYEWAGSFDFNALRERLKVPAEPAVDPAAVDLKTVHIARINLVPIESAPDDAVRTVYVRARQFGIPPALERAALVLAGRPEALAGMGMGPMPVFSDLAHTAMARGDMRKAREWIERGRKADPAAKQARNAPFWDMIELRTKVGTEAPEVWVPELAVILERYSNDEVATQTVLLTLLDMGLIEMAEHPDRPGEQILDSRRLSSILAAYGPRVTTASGRLGVSAAKPEIWTPGGDAAKTGGGLWTPGSGSPAPASGSEAGKKLIIPGR